MTRKISRRRSNRSRRNVASISPVKFHLTFAGTLSGVTGNSVLNMAPQSMTGVSEVADQFDLFRLTQLKYRLHPMDPADTTFQTAAYVPDVDTQTVTTAQNSESPLCVTQTPFCGVPSRWMNVPRSQLKGMLDWYKCSPDSGAAEFEVQGRITIAGGLSDNYILEYDGIIEFKNPVSSSVMMERALDRAVASGLALRTTPAPTPLRGVVPRVQPSPPLKNH